MAHKEQLLFVKNMVELFTLSEKSVVEIGSWDVNGSVRQFFTTARYLGIDIAKGKGVDRVYDGEDLSFLASNSSDVVISCECFEHNPHWRSNLQEMIRICSPGGIILVTCASRGRFEHGTTRTIPAHSLSVTIGWEYYKNIFKNELVNVLRDEPIQWQNVTYNPYRRDLYAILIKEGEMHFNGLLENVEEKVKESLMRNPSGSLDLGGFSFSKIASYLLSDRNFQNVFFAWRAVFWGIRNRGVKR
tara:strand:- start:55 stop:789 length:735 start_codon:yes stop_codon:yes gene_type:complete